MDVSFAPDVSAAKADVDLLAVGVPASATLDDALVAALGDFGRALAGWLADRKFEPKAGSAQVVPTLGAIPARQVAVIGLGDGSKGQVAAAAGKAGNLARNEKATSLALAFGALSADVLRESLEYVHVGNYVYDLFVPEKSRKPALERLVLLGVAESDAANAALREASVRARWQRFARDLVNAPAADIYPESLANEARQLATLPHVNVEVWDFERCRAEGLVGIVAVGQGSARPGVLIHVSYRPPAARDHVAFVGKGVTFDSGGLSLKPSGSMQTMRCDMAGAATVLAAVGAAAELELPVAIDVFCPAVENMNSGTSFKLGDILKYRNGVSVEIHNTDAEGRLILADGLLLASEVEGVSRIVDAATLTGAIVVSLGPDYTGLFTPDDDLAAELTTAANEASEKIWRMPLDESYNRMLKGTWSQIKNVGGRDGGSITAALFLQHFVRKGVKWAHLDIAGASFYDQGNEAYAKGGTGQMVRSLVNFLAAL